MGHHFGLHECFLTMWNLLGSWETPEYLAITTLGSQSLWRLLHLSVGFQLLKLQVLWSWELMLFISMSWVELMLLFTGEYAASAEGLELDLELDLDRRDRTQ